LYGIAVYKEVLYRRGIFTTNLSRAPGRTLDKADQAELEAILTDVSPLFKI
jgi:dihydrodipicolinate synthase/N-acetylneuraminate lyase